MLSELDFDVQPFIRNIMWARHSVGRGGPAGSTEAVKRRTEASQTVGPTLIMSKNHFTLDSFSSAPDRVGELAGMALAAEIGRQ
jgi:hypothetical protein